MEIETNLIYCGDNLEILAKFPEKSVDLIYADPPFFSNKTYEIIWGNGAEMKAYEDRWKGGINVYIEWMKERLWQCYRVLKDTGSMYLHCDWHATHRLRVMMDEIFGEKNFRNEIIWCYSRPSAPGQRQLSRCHETIHWYSKGDKWIFNPDVIRPPYAKSSLEREGYGAKASKIAGGVGVEAVVELKEGGKFPEDWWQIPALKGNSEEYLGFPTQKPEALLKRIIEVSSNKGDVVLDPFAGGGTTPAVAHQLGRKWIAIDVSPIACNKMKGRLVRTGASAIRIIGAPKTIDELKALEPFQFQNWVVDRIGGVPAKKKSSDMGIDGYTFMAREPVQVKQSESVGRNVIDNFETAIRREHKASGYIVAFSFAKSAYEEAARVRSEENLDIKLVRVDEMDKFF